MVFTSYIATIPKELKESVHMDGGKHYHYFIYVILPLMGTPFAVFASITLPWFWNDLLHGLLFLKPASYTLPAFIASIGGTFTTNFEAIFSGVLFSLLPILLVYLIFQKMFVNSADGRCGQGLGDDGRGQHPQRHQILRPGRGDPWHRSRHSGGCAHRPSGSVGLRPSRLCCA